MKDWLEETIDQIALGEYLAKSSVSCGQRFGLIAVDNAVEFMLVAYVELKKRMVGGTGPGRITNKDWDAKKRNFSPLLAFVVSTEPNLATYEDEINRFHDLRNDLYHTGLPMTITAGRVLKYSEVAKEALKTVFSITFTKEQWDETVSKVGAALSPAKVGPSVKRIVSYQEVNETIKFTTSELPTQTEAVALLLHAYAVLTADQPSRPSLVKSLALSGCAMTLKILNARLSDLRRMGWVRGEKLTLTPKGRKELGKKYLLS